MWYKEQGVVRPWQLYTNREKAEMIKHGLGEDDFPFIHPKDRPKDTVEQSLDKVGSVEPSRKMRRVRTHSDEHMSLNARPSKSLSEFPTQALSQQTHHAIQMDRRNDVMTATNWAKLTLLTSR
jgi:hypothetical protein